VLSATSGASVHLDSTVMTGGAGRGLDIDNSTLIAVNIAVHDMLSGGTLNSSDVVIQGSHFADFLFETGSSRPEDVRMDLGKFDDNDALYIAGGSVRIVDTVIVRAGDDCIDAGSDHFGHLYVHNCWVEACRHEGIALSNTGQNSVAFSLVTHTVISHCQQGIELGFSSAGHLAYVERCTLSHNVVGLRLGDNYGWRQDGTLWAHGLWFEGNHHDVLSLDRASFGRVPSDRDTLIVTDSLFLGDAASSSNLEDLEGSEVKEGRHAVLSPVTSGISCGRHAAQGGGRTHGSLWPHCVGIKHHHHQDTPASTISVSPSGSMGGLKHTAGEQYSHVLLVNDALPLPTVLLGAPHSSVSHRVNRKDDVPRRLHWSDVHRQGRRCVLSFHVQFRRDDHNLVLRQRPCTPTGDGAITDNVSGRIFNKFGRNFTLSFLDTVPWQWTLSVFCTTGLDLAEVIAAGQWESFEYRQFPKVMFCSASERTALLGQMRTSLAAEFATVVARLPSLGILEPHYLTQVGGGMNLLSFAAVAGGSPRTAASDNEATIGNNEATDSGGSQHPPWSTFAGAPPLDREKSAPPHSRRFQTQQHHPLQDAGGLIKPHHRAQSHEWLRRALAPLTSPPSKEEGEFNTMGGAAPLAERHSLIVWSSVPATTTRQILLYLDTITVARSTTGAVRVPKECRSPHPWMYADLCGNVAHAPGLQVVGTFRVKRGVVVDVASGHTTPPDGQTNAVMGSFDEAWYGRFYGKDYYHIYDPVNATHQRIVSMEEYKGTGAFTLVVLEDWYPAYDHRDGKGLVNIRMYDLKHTLRTWVPRQYQVHASQTYEEGVADLSFLLGREKQQGFRQAPGGNGGGGRSIVPPASNGDRTRRFFDPGTPLLEPLFPPKQLLRPGLGGDNTAGADMDHRADSEHGTMAIMDLVYVDSFGKSLFPLLHGANAVQAQILQGEWFNYNLDVPELHAELGGIVYNPDLSNTNENVLRSNLLGAYRIALFVHIPQDTSWWSAELPIEALASFTIARETGWFTEFSECSTVVAAAKIVVFHTKAILTVLIFPTKIILTVLLFPTRIILLF
jgi:hypothetical protein